MLFPFRLDSREQVRFVLSSPRYEVNQEGVEGVTVQLVDPAKGLLHRYYTRPDLLLGLDPVKLACRGGLFVCEWVPFRTQLDQ